MTAGAKVWSGTEWVDAVGASTAAWEAPVDLGTARTSSSDADPLMVTVSPSATANTKGAWTQVIASAPESDLLTLIVSETALSAGVGMALCDIGVGASTAESVLVANIQCGHAGGVAGGTGDHIVIPIPVHIPAGTRISVRWQSARASAGDARFGVLLSSLPSASPATVDTIGADTATSSGVVISPPGTHTVMAASTAQAYRGVVATIGANDSVLPVTYVGLDIGVGAEGAEVLYRGPVFTANTNERLATMAFGSPLIWADIPAGSRLTARVTDDSGGISSIRCVLLGIPA